MLGPSPLPLSLFTHTDAPLASQRTPIKSCPLSLRKVLLYYMIELISYIWFIYKLLAAGRGLELHSDLTSRCFEFALLQILCCLILAKNQMNLLKTDVVKTPMWLTLFHFMNPKSCDGWWALDVAWRLFKSSSVAYFAINRLISRSGLQRLQHFLKHFVNT